MPRDQLVPKKQLPAGGLRAAWPEHLPGQPGDTAPHTEDRHGTTP